MMKKTTYLMILLSIASLFVGCTEQYALQTTTFEDALVVEATLTNEFKKQKIKITHTYRLEETGPSMESGASVYVTDDLGTQYDFVESDGSYVSVDSFAAQAGRIYRLNIATAQGKTYQSTGETLTTVSPIQQIVPTVMQRDGQRGVGLVVKSNDPTNTSKYYRYEYEETYKVIAPKWENDRAIVVYDSLGEPTIELIPRVGETKTCYSTEYSDYIIQYTTNALSEDRVDFPVRFISNQNYIITHRYSILVRQYVQSLAAYTFYKTLHDISGSGGSILSQQQPGFFYGNMSSADNPNEKVLGFFEVASFSQQRVFFNYADLFPGEPWPPFFMNCDERIYKFCFSSVDPECRGAALVSAITSNSLLYFAGMGLTYSMVPPPCGDCTRFSSNIRPSFWID